MCLMHLGFLLPEGFGQYYLPLGLDSLPKYSYPLEQHMLSVIVCLTKFVNLGFGHLILYTDSNRLFYIYPV